LAKFKVEWYIDYAGIDGIKTIEVEAENEDEARRNAIDILWGRVTLGEVNEIKRN